MSPRDNIIGNIDHKLRTVDIFLPIAIITNKRILFIGITNKEFDNIIGRSKDSSMLGLILYYLYSVQGLYTNYYGKINSIDEIINMSFLNLICENDLSAILNYIIQKNM